MALQKKNRDQERVIADLRLQLEAQTSQSEVPNASQPTPPVSYANMAAKVAANAPVHAPRSIKKRIVAARAFQTPDLEGPKGFESVYLGRSCKIDRSEVRSRLRRTGIDTGCVLDICYPASGVIGILVHAQYVKEFIATMKETEAEVITDFDPMDAKHIADPKYANHSAADRENIAMQLVHQRAKNTLSFLRPVNVGPVGRSFVAHCWIDDSDIADAFKNTRERLAAQDPKRAAFLFKKTNDSDWNSNEYFIINVFY